MILNVNLNTLPNSDWQKCVSAPIYFEGYQPVADVDITAAVDSQWRLWNGERSMSTFDDREKAFETKFAHDENLQFLCRARRNKLMGRWAAAELGLTGQAVDEFVASVCKAGLAKSGDTAVLHKISADFGRNNRTVPDAELVHHLERLWPLAVQQIQREPLPSLLVP
jgi:hypothetical protein